MSIAFGRVERFHDDQLVVALPDLEIVAKALDRLGVRQGLPDRNAALGLALLSDLANLEEAVHTLQKDADVAPHLARFKEERARSGAPQVADLDLLVKGIHLQFARSFPGWKVTIGKNYRPSPVKGYPHVMGGGDGDPEPTEAPLSGRGAGQSRNHKLGSGVRVGLLDTRMFPDAWLTGRYVARSGDLLDPDQRSFTMFDGHCAFVGSCILQQAPAAEIHVRPVLDSEGDGSAWDAAIAMAEIARTGMDVVNLSFGEFRTDDDSAPMVLETAAKRFSSDTVVVAAAGNNGDVKNLPPELVPDGLEPNSASYPAALVDVVGVGALDQSGNLAPFTPDPAPWISLLARGVGLTGAYVRGVVNIEHKDKTGKLLDSKPVSFDGTAIWEGCSFAAGVVSGAIAARTVPGRRSARQALEELLHPDPGIPGVDIRPYNPDS
ncbi:MAG TPA: S8/S53 family peptidase [Streptosporangiaceae bacterium]|nr:S8/S53 family peptidase [Streptosporangiaceae bacterium]